MTSIRLHPAAHIRSLYVEEDCMDLPYTREIIARAGLPVTVVQGPESLQAGLAPYPQGLSSGKRQLLLCRNRGRFLKDCPGTREYLCCGYQVLNIGMNCPMDCAYCILQAYLNNPWLSFFVNVDDLLAELDAAFVAEPDRFRRIGTGEFTDSLVLDRFTGLSRILVSYMADKKKAILELKTKTVEIDNLAGLDHGGRTVVAWSLNSPRIMAGHELRSATLEQRLAAAARCADWGYRLAFHFDPVVFYPGWLPEYRETIDRLFETVPAGKIAWISIGGLRYMPGLRPLARTRFPGVRFFDEEFVPGLDGKLRYFRTRRVEMYRGLLEALRQRAAPGTCIYLCMESSEIWQQVFGYSPDGRGGLGAMLDQAVSTGG
ncbi:MAG: DNA photolyase [Desulfobacterales bacterium]|nr:DNA photolyase [Desulfobacterales bacterium]